MRLTKKWWFVIVVVPVVSLCIKAGFWQLDRAAEKQQLIERLTVGEATLTLASELLTTTVDTKTYQVRLPVQLAESPLIFLDNRIQDRVAGYEVFATAESIDGGVRLFVNLGWVPGGSNRGVLPEISLTKPQTLEALWVPVTESYLMSEPYIEEVEGAVRVQSLKDMQPSDTVPGMFLARGILPQSAKGPAPRLGPTTHYGYAVQWFLLSLVLVCLATYVYRRGFNG